MSEKLNQAEFWHRMLRLSQTMAGKQDSALANIETRRSNYDRATLSRDIEFIRKARAGEIELVGEGETGQNDQESPLES